MARAKRAPTKQRFPDFDSFWNDGWLEIPQRAEEYVLFGDFRADPEKHRLAHTVGPDRALFRAHRRLRLRRLSSRIRLGSNPLNGSARNQRRKYPLHLISSQPRYRLHSQMDPGPVSAAGKVAGREAVAINPADAKRRGIAEGDVVRVYNARGACLAGAEITDAVRPGVVRLSCGAWYDPAGPDENAICVHGNANVLTRDHGTSKLGQGPTCATTLVEVERWQGSAPSIYAFQPPLFAR